MEKVNELFVDSEYLFNNQSFNIKLERVTLRGHMKLPLKLFPPEVIDVSLGRSVHQFIQTIILSIFNEQDSSSSFP